MFSTIANLKKELNQLDAVIDKGTGTMVEAEKRMEVLAALHFPKTISEDQSQDLELREVSKQEIKTAVWGCGTDKSPGPDGFSFGFYRHFWPVIEHDVYMAVNHFFIHGEIPPGSIPVFHMSIFKVPSKVLHILESIRSHFFNGHDPGSLNGASWVQWNIIIRALNPSKDGTVSSKKGDTSLKWNMESTVYFRLLARRRFDEIMLRIIGEETRWGRLGRVLFVDIAIEIDGTICSLDWKSWMFLNSYGFNSKRCAE
ncbi:hypothetical protein Tco_1337941 [Tanacetum coccineum]